ncbi:GATA zinc finger domain-containing protein 1 isoform X2 [Trachypithecus francoisi]|uniref:GATA zinc finger domain-containing protein 1 isoform X2 n=1 Tax=Trachypithecus francoisi TaxID=54180 RepID=UPI00141B3595|nr:GATA zinc finger domain-containing protein 1 isoform X2 [Trachypithecus francoisi]
MPLGLKPTCSVCKTTSSSMWKKGAQGEILCHHCTGRGGAGSGGAASGAAGGTGGSSGGGGFGAATFASTSATPPQSNGGGGGKQSKQEIHRRSARLRNTKYKSTPAAEKKVSTKGKGRRHIFKLKNPIKAPESVSTIITAESIFYKTACPADLRTRHQTQKQQLYTERSASSHNCIRRQPEGGHSQEESSHQNPNLPAPWSWVLSIQNCEKRMCIV